MRSSSNTMTVVFNTDASVSNGGFMATYTSDEPAGEMLLSRKNKYYHQLKDSLQYTFPKMLM